jgi:hypothetical protein
MAMAAGMQLSFALGVLSRHRAAGLAALVAAATGILLQAGVRSLLASGAARLVRRAQGVLVFALAVLPVAVLAAARRFGDDALDAAVARAGRSTALLPGAVQVSVPSRWGELGAAQGVVWLLGPLVAAALLLVLAERLARSANATAPRQERGAARLWTFRSPVLGLARLQWSALWASELGRFTVFLPFFWLLFLPIAGDAPELKARPELVTMFIWALLPTTLANCTLNQFGFDRGAVKALFLLPISDAQVLYGKAVAFGLVLLVQAVLVAAAVSVLVPQSPAFLVAGPAMTLAVGGLHLLVGQWTSLAWPRPIARRGLKQPPASLVAGLIVLATLIGTVLPLAALWWFLGGTSPAGLMAALVSIALGVGGLFFVFTPLAAKALALRRERLVESLS